MWGLENQNEQHKILYRYARKCDTYANFGVSMSVLAWSIRATTCLELHRNVNVKKLCS